jgi:peptidoglycan/LPS O-acetylase OafA/YrhL
MDAKTNAMKLAGRCIPLAAGLSIAAWLVADVIKEYRDGNTVGFDFAPLAMTIVVPVILGLIAWRWRLAAGIALVLLAMVVLVYSIAQGDQWSWGWSSYLLMLTFTAALLAAGLLNLMVWQRESGTKVTIWNVGTEAVQQKADIMCWAARWISLTVGAWLVVLVLAVLALWNSGVLKYEYGSPAVLLLLLVPLGLAALAWRQHFVGGILITLLSAALLVYSIAKVDSWDSAAPFNIFTIIPSCVIFLASGLLHLVVWLRQMKAAR